MASARLACLALTVLTTGPLTAQESHAMATCPQAMAVYGSAAGASEIVFAGTLSEADGMAHRFTMAFAGSGVTMDGVVMLAGEPDRPWGIVMHQCPEGDATGAEIAACTVWQGPIYAIDGKGGVGWLPVGGGRPDQDTAENLLLPDFSAALMQSAVWRDNRIATLPGDVFSLKACQE